MGSFRVLYTYQPVYDTSASNDLISMQRAARLRVLRNVSDKSGVAPVEAVGKGIDA